MLRQYRSTAIVLALFVSVAFGVACTSAGSDGDADDVRILPIEDILDGDIEIADLTATSGVVRVTTSLDVVCSVVFGTTGEYGAQATDLDMAGGGHRTHAAPMRGLEPDTEYHYRLQGTGPDGTVYISDPMTFRTPPADTEVRTNLAGAEAGAEVTDVSSVFGDSPSWAAEHAIDGDPTTEWSSAGDGDAAYLVVALPELTTIASLGIWTRTMGSTAQIITFQVVADGDRILGPFEVPDASGVHEFVLDAPIEAQTLRFEVLTSTGGNTGLVEFGAYGE
ncbi:MAG: discoidin domain-containing protein [Dehalococcoidia bacterium]